MNEIFIQTPKILKQMADLDKDFQSSYTNHMFQILGQVGWGVGTFKTHKSLP